MRIRRILFASDLSPASRPAFSKAVEMAGALRAEIIVTHVLSLVLPVGGMRVSPTMWEAVEAAAHKRAQGQIDRLRRKAAKAGVRTSSVLSRGTASDEIVRCAKRKKAGLIVMGTHGRTGFSSIVMGSVASRVIARAGCPVLVVRQHRRAAA